MVYLYAYVHISYLGEHRRMGTIKPLSLKRFLATPTTTKHMQCQVWP